MKAKQPKPVKGLTDKELIAKYEQGKNIDLKKMLKPLLKKPKLPN